ncbi:MAG: molybdopterin-guanine dinucleotide biosynthesis protein B [Candidatus Saliniplasma sp.]
MSIPHIAVVGKSKTGKTSLVIELIKRLKKEGYEVATVKHTLGDFSIDSEGTDTFEHAEAGSELVVFSTPLETSFIVKDELRLGEILSYIGNFGEYDLVIIEGMKESNIPKLSTDKVVDGDLYYDDNVNEVLDWIDKQFRIFDILDQLPQLDCGKCGYDTCKRFAESVLDGENKIDECNQSLRDRIELIVNGEEIDLGIFPSNIIKNTILGMINSLKGVESIDSLEIRLKE